MCAGLAAVVVNSISILQTKLSDREGHMLLAPCLVLAPPGVHWRRLARRPQAVCPPPASAWSVARVVGALGVSVSSSPCLVALQSAAAGVSRFGGLPSHRPRVGVCLGP